MTAKENISKRLIFYILELNFIAIALVLNIRYNLGVAAFSSVMYSISSIYGISLGIASIICYLIFVLAQCILSRKITAMYLIEIPFSFAFGFLTDFYDMIIPDFTAILPIRVILFLATMFLTALGVFLYVNAAFMMIPTEGIVETISKVFSSRFSLVKNIFDISMVVISVLLCLFYRTPLYGIGAGTILSAFCIGRIIKIYESFLSIPGNPKTVNVKEEIYPENN